MWKKTSRTKIEFLINFATVVRTNAQMTFTWSRTKIVFLSMLPVLFAPNFVALMTFTWFRTKIVFLIHFARVVRTELCCTDDFHLIPNKNSIFNPFCPCCSHGTMLHRWLSLAVKWLQMFQIIQNTWALSLTHSSHCLLSLAQSLLRINGNRC